MRAPTILRAAGWKKKALGDAWSRQKTRRAKVFLSFFPRPASSTAQYLVQEPMSLIEGGKTECKNALQTCICTLTVLKVS